MNTIDTEKKNTTNKKENIRVGAVIVGLMVLATVLSFVFFQQQSLRLDESQSLWQTSHSPAMILNLIAQDVHVPLYHMMLHVWQYMFGNGVPQARMLSLIFFVLSIPVLYMVGRTAYNTRTSLFATVMYAISPFMNWYGNETRMYSLLVLVVLLNQFFFLRLSKYEEGKSTTADWVGFAVTAFFGMYTHYFFFLVLATNAVFFFLNRNLFPKDALKKFVLICTGLFFLFLPWLIYVVKLGKASNTKPSLVLPTSINLFNTFSQFIFGFQTDYLNTILLSMWPLTILLGFWALRRNKKVSPQTVFFIVSFILPNLIAFGVSFIFEPIYLTRYLIFALPALYLFISWLIMSYPKVLSITIRTLIIVGMLATLMTEALSTLTPVKENYEQATAYITQKSSPSDVIVISSPFTIYPVMYYYKGPLTIDTIPAWDRSKFGPIPAFSLKDLPNQINTIKGDHENLWLLVSYDQGYQKDVLQYMDSHYQRLDVHVFSPGMTLYEYKLRYDTTSVIGLTTEKTPKMPIIIATSTSSATTTSIAK